MYQIMREPRSYQQTSKTKPNKKGWNGASPKYVAKVQKMWQIQVLVRERNGYFS
jgi:hypothetical protein